MLQKNKENCLLCGSRIVVSLRVALRDNSCNRGVKFKQTPVMPFCCCITTMYNSLLNHTVTPGAEYIKACVHRYISKLDIGMNTGR